MGHQPPVFAHLPMILGQDGARLSKRHGAVNVMNYRDDGFLPHALLNYLVRLGWSHGDQEVFSREELIKLFDVRDVNRAPARFDMDKLTWLNQHYLKTDAPFKGFVDLAPNGWRWPTLPSWGKIFGALDTGVAAILREEVGIKDGLARMQQEAQQLLDEDVRLMK